MAEWEAEAAMLAFTTALGLPPGTHAAILTATDPFRSPLAYAVVWSDRPSDECPGCERALARVEPDCPVVLHSNGAVDRSQWHECDHCGADIMAPWQEVRPSVPGAGATTDDIRAAAGELIGRHPCTRHHLVDEENRQAGPDQTRFVPAGTSDSGR